jgi:magnesium transporter
MAGNGREQDSRGKSRIAADQTARRARPHRRVTPGASPGTLVVAPGAVPTSVRICSYGADGVDEPEFVGVDEARASLGRHPVTWVRVAGLGDPELLRRVGESFGMHPLALEDVGNTHQRAKVDDYDDQLFVIVRAPIPGEECGTTEQLALVLGAGFLLTFEERALPCLEPVLARIRQGRGRIRQRGADYLAYAVIDTVVDSYFPVLETVTARFDELEGAALDGRVRDAPASIYRLQRQLAALRQEAWPHREAVHTLLRDDSGFVQEVTRHYFRDCLDHATHVIEGADHLRDRGHGLMGLLVSLSGARMNEIMKVLTIIATIFIPLTFVAGLYGMNFDREASPWSMPELGWRWGYPAVLGVMVAVAVGMLLYFHRIGWIGRRSRDEDPLR